MKVALHYIAKEDAPQGVWWEAAPGQVREFYYRGSPLEARGRYLMHQKLDDVPWADYFDQLADCTPVDDDWETAEVQVGVTPREFLESLRIAA